VSRRPEADSRDDGRLVRYERQIAALEAISSLLQQPFNLRAILDAVSQTACRLLRCEAASVMLIARGTYEMTIEGSHGLTADYVGYVNHERRIRIDAGELSMGPSGQAYQTRLPVVSSNAAADPRLLPWREHGSPPYAAMVALPLEFQGEVIGILNSYSTRPRDFAPEEVSLLGLLAAQAAVAIGVTQLLAEQRHTIEELQVLNERLREQHEKLARSAEIHDALTGVVLDGGGIGAIVETLGRHAANPAVLYDERLQAVTPEPEPLPARLSLDNLRAVHRPVRFPAQPEAGVAHPSVVVGVRRGGELLGFLRLCEVGRPAGEIDLAALEHAAQVCAIEFMRQRTLSEAEARIKRDLVLDLVQHRVEDPSSVLRRAEGLGLDLRPPYRVIVLEPDADEVSGRSLYAAAQATAATVGPPALATRDGRHVILLWPEGARTDARAAAERTRRQMDGGCSAGIGRLCTGLGDLHRSYGEALKALRLVRMLGGRGEVVDFPSLGVQRVILEASQPERLLEFARAFLAPVAEHDRRFGGELTRTLRVYLDLDRSLKRTAAQLFVHPNTVAYRIQKVEELCGVDLRRTADALSAELALTVIRLAGEAGHLTPAG
jgi:sugar diacid utilization regulator